MAELELMRVGQPVVSKVEAVALPSVVARSLVARSLVVRPGVQEEALVAVSAEV